MKFQTIGALACLCVAAQTAPAQTANGPDMPVTADGPDLPVKVTWLGNTFSGMPFPAYVPLSIKDISVSGDGTVATNSEYNESGTSVITIRDGHYLGKTNHQIQGSGSHSVVAEDPDNRFLFFSSYSHGAGRAASDGSEDPVNVTYEVNQSWPEKPFVKRLVAGLAVRGDLLFASDATGDDGFNGVRVIDKTTLHVLRSFPLPRAAKLAATLDGNVWVVQHGGTDGTEVLGQDTVLLLSGSDGSVLQKITDVATVGGIAVDVNNRLLIADHGPDCDVKIYSPQGQKLGSFGTKGGIFAGPVMGQVGPARFEKLQGIGVDAKNNLYVLCCGSVWPAVNRIECYAPDGNGVPTWGTLKWRVVGMMFGDVATFDPTDDSTLYTSCGKLHFDYSKSDGQEWSYVATTLGSYLYPEDPRRCIFAQGFAGRSTYGIRVIAGHKFLFTGLGNIDIERFSDATGEIGIPSVWVCLRDPSIDKALPGWPPDRPKGLGSFIWRDTNGDGKFEADEYTPTDPRMGGSPEVDGHGNLWWFPQKAGKKVYCLPVNAKLDDVGNPVYDPANMRSGSMPADYLTYSYCHLDDATGDLVVVGKRPDDTLYSMSLYPGWRDNPAVAAKWTVTNLGKYNRHEIFIPNPTDVGPVQVAGDYVFLSAAVNMAVRVFKRSDGNLVGWLRTPVKMLGTADSDTGFVAHERANGEYDLISADFFHNNNVVYRWKP